MSVYGVIRKNMTTSISTLTNRKSNYTIKEVFARKNLWEKLQ